jgi:hypothetical protein
MKTAQADRAAELSGREKYVDAWHGAQTEEERIAREARRLKGKPPS